MYQTPRFTNLSNIQSNTQLNPQLQLNLSDKYPSNQQSQHSLLSLRTKAQTKTRTKVRTWSRSRFSQILLLLVSVIGIGFSKPAGAEEIVGTYIGQSRSSEAYRVCTYSYNNGYYKTHQNLTTPCPVTLQLKLGMAVLYSENKSMHKLCYYSTAYGRKSFPQKFSYSCPYTYTFKE